jgi:seryl-tRNA synthetase
LLPCRQCDLLQEQAAANQAVEDGKKANRDEKMFMQTALSHHKAAKAKQEEERKKQKHSEKRIKAILSLKDNITSSEVWGGRDGKGEMGRERWGCQGPIYFLTY